MYKLIIVDDEEEIRDGLCDIIDWMGMGFLVAAKLQDGRDAIRYLQEHEVDVILTDIKMTFVSGIDLARHVYDKKLNIKVVVLSGFQEFALAREAIRYNVSHYLLKPTDLDDVSDVFRKIYSELEEAKREWEQSLRQRQDVKTLRSLLMEQLYFNLIFEGGWDKEMSGLDRRLTQLGLSVESDSGVCCVMRVAWSSSIVSQTKRDSEERQVLSVAITKEWDQVHYTCVHLGDNTLLIIGNALAEMSLDGFQKKAEQYFLHTQSTVPNLLGLTVRLEWMELFTSIRELLDQRYFETPDVQEKPVVSADKEMVEHERIIIRQAKQFISGHFEMDLMLTEVSRHVGLNPVYFSRLFKQETGMTYSDYVIDLRMKKAMDYLKDPKYKVYEIGFLVGYRNTKYFHKLFKRQTGLTPSEYRDKL